MCLLSDAVSSGHLPVVTCPIRLPVSFFHSRQGQADDVVLTSHARSPRMRHATSRASVLLSLISGNNVEDAPYT